MSGDASSKFLFQTALRCFELIDDAYFGHGGKIILTEENASDVNALIKHRLAWQFDEMEDAQLSGSLLKLLERTGSVARRSRGSDEIAILWKQLEQMLEDYIILDKKGRDNEVERLSHDMSECAFEMMELIESKLTIFATYIDQGFAAVSDIDLRLLHNKRALTEAEQLNNILQGCDLRDFSLRTSSDPALRKLFKQYLPRSITLCHKELVRVLHDLRKLVTKLQADSELAKKLISFKRHYDQNPGFKPTEVPFMERIPSILTQAEQAKSFAYADIGNDDHTKVIVNAISLVKQSIFEHKVLEAEELSIEDVSNNDLTSQDIGELYQKSLAVIAVAKSGEEVLASSSFKVLAVSTDYSYWLLALLNTVSGLDKSERMILEVDVISEEHPLFNGNQTVTDVRLTAC